jgi:HTH-type transcriptional regulator/antitoxin HigA
MAASLLVPSKELASFIARHRPRFSKQAICGFASQLGVHPGIVAGQLQHRGQISYSHSREMLLPVRRLITEVAITDGWR